LIQASAAADWWWTFGIRDASQGRIVPGRISDVPIHYTALHDQQQWGQTPEDVSVLAQAWRREWYSSLVELLVAEHRRDSR
jgi:hypothetical protein